LQVDALEVPVEVQASTQETNVLLAHSENFSRIDDAPRQARDAISDAACGHACVLGAGASDVSFE
jgi:hypothetical protein